MERKKKIVHIIQSLESGGCENMLLRTLPLITDFKHQIITLKEAGELAKKFEHFGITVTHAECRGFTDFSGILRLRNIIVESQPDAILTYLFHADVMGRLVLGGTTQAPIIPFIRTTYNHPRYRIARLFEWLTKPLVKQYLANSEAVKDFYTQRIGVMPKRITVIPNGIDVDSFDRIEPDQKLRENLNIAPPDFVIISVANLHTNKGHRYLLEAFESISQEFPHAWLLIVGDGEERENLESQAGSYRSKSRILFLSRRNDVSELLKISNLFVLPTLFEGQSNAILEAFAAGVPVITTDIPENRTLITHEKSGLLVPVQNAASLGNALREALTDIPKIRSFAEEARATVRRNYALNTIVERWNKFLRTL